VCGRFATRSKSWSEVFSAMDLIASRENKGDVYPHFNLGPMQRAPIAVSDGTDIWGVRANWGLIPVWWKKDLSEKKFSTFNAKSESITETASYKDQIKHHRCLVPADAFYEWKREDKKKKQAFAIGMNDKSRFSMAGPYTHWKGEYKGDEWEGYSFSILTCSPNPMMEAIHHRMPVILHGEDTRTWLKGTEDDALALAVSYPSQNMTTWEVDPRVGKISENDEDLLEPIKHSKLI